MRTFRAHIVMYSMILLLSLANRNYPAYSSAPAPDKIFVHLDKAFYVAGESIHYKIYFLNEGEMRKVDVPNLPGESYISSIQISGKEMALCGSDNIFILRNEICFTVQ